MKTALFVLVLLAKFTVIGAIVVGIIHGVKVAYATGKSQYHLEKIHGIVTLWRRL